MSEVETVEVPNVGTPLRAPVELVGVVAHNGYRLGLVTLATEHAPVGPGDVLIVRPSVEAGSWWRPGRACVDADGHARLSTITAACEGDYVYRIGRPTTPTLEERVAELEFELARRTISAPDPTLQFAQMRGRRTP